MRECGLKLDGVELPQPLDRVTPCAGVWIEIHPNRSSRAMTKVTPCAGVWIEICLCRMDSVGLYVTPCAGVWIEISGASASDAGSGCHSLCGSVD